MTNVLMLFIVKLTVVLGIGAALAALLRGRSAATRHFVWALTLCGAVAMAIAGALAPPMTVEIQDWRPAEQIAAVAAPAPVHTFETPATIAQPVTPTPVRTMPSWTTIVAAIWLAGFAVMLTWLLAGHAAVRRVARTAVPADDDALIDNARRQIGVSRKVRVASSPAVTAPFTSGFTRPIILLPAGASTWPEERRRAALLHELAHVARNDYLVHLLAGFACALYWFHPAVWFALRGLRRESEQATDDRVIARGMMPPDYATHLLDVARGARGRGVVDLLVVGMACPSHLETRLRALLDETRRRGTVSRRIATTASIAVALVLVPLAAAQPELRAAMQTPAKKQTIDTPTPTPTPTPTVTRTATPSSRTAPSLHRVFDMSPGGTLVLDLETGGNVEIVGIDAQRVELEAYLRGRNAANSIVDATVTGSEVRVTAKFDRRGRNYSTSHQFVVRVPRQFNVNLDSSGGGISIAGVEGTFEGTTGGGEIALTRVSGRARLSTGGGDIDVTDVDLEGRVTTGGGKVRLTRVRGGLRGTSGSGEVIRNEASPSSSDAGVRINTPGGRIDLEEALNGATLYTGGGGISVGRARGVVDAQTGGGRIELGPVEGSVRAVTGSGAVVIRLADAPSLPEQVVDVTSGSGQVIVELPRNFGGRFEIETAYTESHGPVVIKSDFPLQHDPLTGWESSRGTPRRFLRARGTTGDGRGLVRIRTTNGHVTIRRGE